MVRRIITIENMLVVTNHIEIKIKRKEKPWLTIGVTNQISVLALIFVESHLLDIFGCGSMIHLAVIIGMEPIQSFSFSAFRPLKSMSN